MAQDSAGGLESCLNLLRGNIDEQRLVGLLLATKLIKGEDSGAIVQIFNAMGVNFITRLLKSGTHGSKEEESYVQLAMSVFSAFCRVPELAASKEIIEMIPTLLEILRKWPEGNASADCLDCLLGIASASEQGINALRKSGVFPLLMDSLTRFKSDSESLHSAVKLVQIILAANVLEHDIICSSGNIISAIQNLANLLLHEQGSSKLDILLLFQRLFRSKILFQIQISSNSSWVTLMRNSIGHMLQSQSGIELKLLALDLTKSMVDIFSSSWLLGPMVLPGERKEMPVDRFFLLLVETLRVEALVILNEVAHSRFNTESSMNSKSDEFMKRKYQLALVYSLLESVIELSLEEDDISRLSDTALQRTIPVLNDIMSTVIDFLEEAKRHSTVTGDDILASARFLSRFLADIPAVQRKFGEKLLSMLEYLFKVKSESEESPFLVIQFLLPAVCGITKEMKACESFVSWGGHKQVINFIHDVIRNNQVPSGLLINAGDIILNLLQKTAHRRFWGHGFSSPTIYSSTLGG
ncbi:hypothetical protein KP509_17G015300 [Ceratopteris richardii]|uniref:Neurochondrin n=1 Tax=Ceratopteris richardii TaxID=49495 RepID=A0A8T2SSD1_CERRI|nr:hypothetical protein KP509_17G015300 [Ceratopteris richardii]